jgi:transposase
MKAQLAALQEQNRLLKAELAALRQLLTELQVDNKFLRKKVDLLLARLFGRKSEKLNKAQLELLLGDLDALSLDDDDPPPSGPGRPRRRRKSKPRLPEDLPTEDIHLDPDEVTDAPQNYRRIGEEITEELDVIPAKYVRRRYIRGKYVDKRDRGRPPITAPLPDRIIEGGYAGPGLLTDIILKKYEDHLPLHRQEQILRRRYGIELSRKTMTDWVRVVADWLKPIYNHIQKGLRKTGYLQVDESPVKYCRAEGGGSSSGYFWVYHPPGGDVLYEWHTGRSAACLDGMLKDFHGTVQCDGYGAYTSYTRDRDDIELAGCWAHTRRKFHEALEEAPKEAGWFLTQVGLLYRVEDELRVRNVGARLRQVARASQSRMVAARIGRALKIKLPGHLPRSQMGKAISYALSHWDQLNRYLEDGRIEIDTNLVENAIRPTAVGKKNWLFIGHPQAGQRSAIIYTILETCKRHGINPQEYLHEVLSRLPSMKITQVGDLTPAAWAAQRKAKAA